MSSTDPINVATDVCIDKEISATFDRAMDPTSINSDPAGTLLNFTLRETVSGTNVPGTVAMNSPTNTIATFTPLAGLTAGLGYTATIKGGATGVKDIDGNALAVDKVWSFTVGTGTCAAPGTIPASCLGPGPVDIGAAATFGVLAGPVGVGSLTNNGLATMVNGDVGAATQTTAPAQSAGFFNYTGTDAEYVAASTAMLTAIGCASSRPCSAGLAFNFPAAHDFGGDTLQPGVYCVTGAMDVGSNLTLSTPGVYIFRSTGGLTSANTITVAFGGSANATNTSVFWVPTGAVVLGTNNIFLGTIMPDADAAITLGANTTLIPGRVLSNSAVTLDTNIITIP